MKTIQNQIKSGIMAILALITAFDAGNRGYDAIEMALLFGSMFIIIIFLFYSHQEIQ